jgi:serine phosphatase RsbU (regulator of sigma subunit)
MPLGLFAGAGYESGSAVVHGGGSLLLFSDGLPDSISGSDPERLMEKAVVERQDSTMSNLISLINRDLNEDDVTIMLLKRDASPPSGRREGV